MIFTDIGTVADPGFKTPGWSLAPGSRAVRAGGLAAGTLIAHLEAVISDKRRD